MKLFVTGASGFIGARFCAAAIEKGHSVVALVRPSSAGRIPPGITRVYGSLPYDVPADAVEQADAVVHLAAITTADKATQSVAVNELGTSFLLKVSSRNSARFLFMSTQSAHGGNNSAYAATKRASEEQLRQSGLPWVIVRPGLVYGPGNTGLFARMRQVTRRLPVVPMLGGGKALVQPVHVDDLCTALLTIVERFEEFNGSDLFLGDPEGISLKDFLRRVAAADGKGLRQLPVPLAPVTLAVKGAEALRVPFPISRDNIKGLETVERMDTAPSLERLGLELRDLDEGLRDSRHDHKVQEDDRVPVILIGAGKIGIVHGLQIMQNPHVLFAGVVEPNPKARKLYRSMGFAAPFVDSLEEALALSPAPVAAVIATPADTHLSIATQCLAAGLHILIEKPLSINDQGEGEWRQLRTQYPGQVIHSGYMAAQFPHLFTAFHLARMNKLGHIHRVNLVALQTHISAAEPVRWEMLKDRAGGGVLINFGCHVASMLFRLLGWPEGDVQGWQWPVYSTEVEDALVARFAIRSTQCTLVTSWSVEGYARPQNLVELECARGTVRIENSSVTVIQDDSVNLLETQLDFPLAFNMAPDYTGAGFSLEHESFISAVRGALKGRGGPIHPPEYMPPVELPEALRLENWIRHLYKILEPRKPTQQELQSAGIDGELAKLLFRTGLPASEKAAGS